MITRGCSSVAGVLFMMVIAGLLLEVSPARAQDKNKPVTGKIPNKVMDALKAKFPNSRIDKWSKEKGANIVVYDIEFKQEGRKFEADIKEDGNIHNWEKAVEFKDLPPAVLKAVDTKYPKDSVKEIMEVTAVKNGKDELEGYEMVLECADKKEVEVTVAPDGKILEDSGEKK